jgi:hypothetical protein
VYGSDEEEVTGVDLTRLAPGEHGFVVVATTVGSDSGWWYGYVLDGSRSCATVTSQSVTTVSSGGGTVVAQAVVAGGKKYTLDFRGCDPDYMFVGGNGMVAGCIKSLTAGAAVGESFYTGVFRYVCTRGYGGPIRSVEVSGQPGCTLSPGGVVDQTDGNGYGASLAAADSGGGQYVVVHGGIGYLDGDEITSGTCDFVVDTSQILVQPVSRAAAFNVATAGIEVVNVTEYTGYFGEASEVRVSGADFDHRLVIRGFELVVVVYDVIMTGLLIGLTFFRASVLGRIKKRLST